MLGAFFANKTKWNDVNWQVTETKTKKLNAAKKKRKYDTKKAKQPQQEKTPRKLYEAVRFSNCENRITTVAHTHTEERRRGEREGASEQPKKTKIKTKITRVFSPTYDI